MTDVADYLALAGLPASQISNLTVVNVGGGATPGANQNEVLEDIDIILTNAPGAKVRVYEAPFNGAGNSFQPVINQMISDGVTIISNSWSYCEDQTTQSDANSIDTLFKTAAGAGITVFNAAGDTGSTCLDGSSNTIGVPADSPNATAVGGTSLTPGPGFTYGSETWWNGVTETPLSGQGGFGTSKFFTTPVYQDGFNLGTNRSIPDLSVNADPAHGVILCQQSGGGCPTGLVNGGTSGGAPTWAAFQALLNQSVGEQLGFVNPTYYGFGSTDAFHNATLMGSDFAHVGLGSPNLDALHLLLCGGQPAGAVNGTDSEVLALLPGTQLMASLLGVPADGTTAGGIEVLLKDANGNSIAGKTVTLGANSTNVGITPSSGVTSDSNGSFLFKATDLTAENVIFTATDTSDSLTLPQTATLAFLNPPATSAGIGASPSSVTANGVASSTVTVTLKDSLSRPSPGKQIILSQGGGHSNISGPSLGRD